MIPPCIKIPRFCGGASPFVLPRDTPERPQKPSFSLRGMIHPLRVKQSFLGHPAGSFHAFLTLETTAAFPWAAWRSSPLWRWTHDQARLRSGQYFLARLCGRRRGECENQTPPHLRGHGDGSSGAGFGRLRSDGEEASRASRKAFTSSSLYPCTKSDRASSNPCGLYTPVLPAPLFLSYAVHRPRSACIARDNTLQSSGPDT